MSQDSTSTQEPEFKENYSSQNNYLIDKRYYDNKIIIDFMKCNKLFKQDYEYIKKYSSYRKQYEPLKYIIEYRDSLQTKIYNSYKNRDLNLAGYINVCFYIDNNMFPLNENFDRDILYNVINLEQLYKLEELEFIEGKYNNRLTLEQYKYISDIAINTDEKIKSYNKIAKYINNFFNEIYVNNSGDELLQNGEFSNKLLEIFKYIIKVIYCYITYKLIHKNKNILLNKYIRKYDEDETYYSDYPIVFNNIISLLMIYYYSHLSKEFIYNNFEHLNIFTKEMIDIIKEDKCKIKYCINIVNECVNIDILYCLYILLEKLYKAKNKLNSYYDKYITIGKDSIIQHIVKLNNDLQNIQNTNSQNVQNTNSQKCEINDKQCIFKIDTANFNINL